jgi:hypothetical protein
VPAAPSDIFADCPHGPHRCDLDGRQVRGHMGQDWSGVAHG